MRRPAVPEVLGRPDECDCPACSGADFDPQRLIDELLAGAGELIGAEDPLDVEIAGAALLAIGEVAGEAFEEAVVGGFIPEFEARATPEAVAMLLAIGSVAGDRVGKAASAAADRLVRSGIHRPGWAGELDEPVTLIEGWRLTDAEGTASMLIGSFRRAGRSHHVVVSVDHLDCGAAEDILLYPGEHLATALEALEAAARDGGIEITPEMLDPAQLRWHVENALAARAVHDRDERELGTTGMPVEDDDLPGYGALAVLLRGPDERSSDLGQAAGAARGRRSAPRRARYRRDAACREQGRAVQFADADPAPWSDDAGQAAPEAEAIRRGGTGVPDQGGTAGGETADLATPGGARRYQPRPPALGHPGRVRLG